MISRGINKSKHLYCSFHFFQSTTANQNISFGKVLENNSTKNNKLPEEALKTIGEYKDALNYYQQGKYRISDELFKRVLNILEQTNLQQTNNYTHVLKKFRLVSTQLMLRRYLDAEKYLEKIVDTIQSQTTNEALIYASFNDLFLHRLKTNLNQAIKFRRIDQVLGYFDGKSLTKREGKKFNSYCLSKEQQSIASFILQTAYLLKGNYIDAKNRLRECLTLDPNHQLKGFALNNLAVASWWHKFPNFKIDPSNDEGNFENQSEASIQKYSYQQIDQDFSNVLPLLKNSISQIENLVTFTDEKKKDQLKELLNQNTLIPEDTKAYDPDTNLLITNRLSGTPLINIGEFLFNTNPEKRSEASFWFKYALKFFERNDPANIDRTLITLGLFLSSSKQYIKAEGIFRKTLEMLDNSDSYNKVLCLQLYGNMLTQIEKRQKEGESRNDSFN